MLDGQLSTCIYFVWWANIYGPIHMMDIGNSLTFRNEMIGKLANLGMKDLLRFLKFDTQAVKRLNLSLSRTKHLFVWILKTSLGGSKNSKRRHTEAVETWFHIQIGFPSFEICIFVRIVKREFFPFQIGTAFKSSHWFSELQRH